MPGGKIRRGFPTPKTQGCAAKRRGSGGEVVLATHNTAVVAMSGSRSGGECRGVGRSSPGYFADYHIPVMAAEAAQGLIAGDDAVYVDGTLGEGGHSEAILRALPAARLVIGIDLDSRSVAAAAGRLASFGSRFRPLHGNYADMVSLAAGQGVTEADGVLLDLGFSSRQVDRAGYGMSFQSDEPLDMRYDAGQSLDAAEVVNSFSERELADLFRRYGEEPRAGAVARAIVRERAAHPVRTTGALAALAERAVGLAGKGRRGRRVHPATRVFQALRIAVNGELDNLRAGLAAAVGLLRPQGRLAVISYHSLEDRIVKNFLARGAAACVCPPGLPACVCGHRPTMEIVNRRVIRPSGEETAANPRSRSARLRLARRI